MVILETIRQYSARYVLSACYNAKKQQKVRCFDMIEMQIAALRRNAGMTQKELAQHIHVSASAIGMYEQGRRLPTVPILVSLAEVFDVTIDYLVTGKPCELKNLSNSNSSLSPKCLRCNPEHKDLNMSVLREMIAYLYKTGTLSSVFNAFGRNSSSG